MTTANIKFAVRLRGEVLNAIARGTFDYAAMFPNSKHAGYRASKAHQCYLVSALVDTYIDTAREIESMTPSSIATYARWARARINPKWSNLCGRAHHAGTARLDCWLVQDLGAQVGTELRRFAVCGTEPGCRRRHHRYQPAGTYQAAHRAAPPKSPQNLGRIWGNLGHVNPC